MPDSTWPARRATRRRRPSTMPPQHLQVVALAVGMQPVGEHDQEGLGRGIDPDRRAGIAGMAVGLRREGRRQPHGIGRIDVPAEAAQGRAAGRALRLRHGRDRGRLQHALAARQHHLRELREVVGGGEQRRRGPRRRPCDRRCGSWTSPQRSSPPSMSAGRDAVPQRSGRPERGVAHAERLEDVLGGVGVERLARHAPHDLAQHDEVDVAVDEARAGRAPPASARRWCRARPRCPTSRRVGMPAGRPA